MQITLEEDKLILMLEGAERLWAFKLGPITVPRAHVAWVSGSSSS